MLPDYLAAGTARASCGAASPAFATDAGLLQVPCCDRAVFAALSDTTALLAGYVTAFLPAAGEGPDAALLVAAAPVGFRLVVLLCRCGGLVAACLCCELAVLLTALLAAAPLLWVGAAAAVKGCLLTAAAAATGP